MGAEMSRSSWRFIILIVFNEIVIELIRKDARDVASPVQNAGDLDSIGGWPIEHEIVLEPGWEREKSKLAEGGIFGRRACAQAGMVGETSKGSLGRGKEAVGDPDVGPASEMAVDGDEIPTSTETSANDTTHEEGASL
jgi:hypothetical protein